MSDVGHIDKHVFSAPQNRRASLMKTASQKSHNSSISRKSKDSSFRGGIDSSLRGGMDRQTSGSVALRPVEPKMESSRGEADAGVVEDALGATRKSFSKSRSSIDGSRKGLQEVLGALPILLVDDSVSILKMTKRSIQNECANIR